MPPALATLVCLLAESLETQMLHINNMITITVVASCSIFVCLFGDEL